MWRVSINEQSGEVQGEPEPVTSGEAPLRNFLSLSSRTGDAVYSVETIHRNIERYEFDPVAESVVGGPVPITEGSALRTWLSPSPDGEWLKYEHDDHLVVRSWSPDGSRFLGSWPSDHSGKMGIGIYNLDTETYEMVLDFAAAQPRWLSDGRRFLFISDADWIERGPLVAGGPPSSLYIGDRVTREYHEILNLARDVIWRGYGVTGDDRTIFIPRERRESDIWRLELK